MLMADMAEVNLLTGRDSLRPASPVSSSPFMPRDE
jgi:hypothetical protein